MAALFQSGNLYLNGDGLANELRLEGTGAGAFTVTAIATQLNQVNNGQQNFAGVRNIFLNLGQGDDVVTFINADLPGMLSVNAGPGADAVQFGEDANGDQFFGSVAALMGDGDDRFEVVGSGVNPGQGEDTFTVPGLVSINSGEGANVVDLDPGVQLSLGFVSILSGGGDDFVNLCSTAVTAQNVLISNGGGDNFVFLDGNVTISANLTVFGLQGDDTINPGFFGGNEFTVLGSATFNLGDGDNIVQIEQRDVAVRFALSVITGGGADQVAFTGDTMAAGALTVFTGLGDDQVNLTSGVATTVAGPATIVTSSGADVVNVLFAEFRGIASLNTGEGDDDVFIDNSLFRQAAFLYTQGGDDQVAIEAGGVDDGVGTVFAKSVLVNLGNGDDELTAGFDADDFVTVLGAVHLDGGRGDDVLVDSLFNEFFGRVTVRSFL